jgi:hypothetical protein
MQATRNNLNDIMEFEYVVKVDEDGNVERMSDVYAPSLYDGELDSSEWTLVGNSGQQGGGHLMHNSEFIGGGLADMILETPGYYVAVVCYWGPDDNELEDPDYDENTYDGVEGWGVAYRESL